MKLVLTSIFPPTRAVSDFARLEQIDEVVVVGDLKTPVPWAHPGCRYFGTDFDWAHSALAAKLPWNHYSRKNLGYLAAMVSGQPIAESDDDNIPYSDWAFPDQMGFYDAYRGDLLGIVNQYSMFADPGVWPRGLPLDRILSAPLKPDAFENEQVKVGLWQGLADGDPDVDAIYRLVRGTEVTFRDRAPIVFQGGVTCPINSQNTLWYPEMYPAMYLPSTVTFRYTDILRGYVASAVAASMGLSIGVTKATVFQERNPHDFVRDFESEIPVYLTGARAFDLSMSAVSDSSSASEAVKMAYDALASEGIVARSETELVGAWLEDVAAAAVGDSP